MDRPCAMKTLPGISAFPAQRRPANWKHKLERPPRDFRGSPIHSKPPNVTLPSSAMRQTDAITIARLLSVAALNNYAGNRTFELRRPFERLAHSNDVCVRMTVPVRMISVSRGTIFFRPSDDRSTQKHNLFHVKQESVVLLQTVRYKSAN